MTATRAIDTFVKLAGVAALLLGLALCSGRLYGLVDLHRALGVAVVLGLWALAILALRQGAAHGPAFLALLWGPTTLALGFAQGWLLVGEFHWIVQVVHLLLGLGAIALGSVQTRALFATRLAAKPQETDGRGSMR